MQGSVFRVLAMLIVLGGAGLARAELCPKCRDLMFVDSPGKCRDCGGETASGALKLCPKCSAVQHRCEHCLETLDGTGATAPAWKPTAKPPVDNTPVDNTPAQDAPAGRLPAAAPPAQVPPQPPPQRIVI